MSERHFAACFTDEVGEARRPATSPRVRVEAARRALEATDDTVAAIARRVRVRHRRDDAPHVRPPTSASPPDDYRRRFSHQPERTTTMPCTRRSPSPCSPSSPRSTPSARTRCCSASPSFDITFIGHERGEVRRDNGFLGIQIDATFEEMPRPDVIVFPGGVGTRALMHDERVLDWVRTAHQTTTFTTSVCTGSLVLAAAGLLDGLTATTHWSAIDTLAEHGAIPTSERVVEHLDRRIITAAGVSSGIDMALRLVELLVDRTAAEAMQLMIEYDPQPPFDAARRTRPATTWSTRVIEYAARTSQSRSVSHGLRDRRWTQNAGVRPPWRRACRRGCARRSATASSSPSP